MAGRRSRLPFVCRSTYRMMCAYGPYACHGPWRRANIDVRLNPAVIDRSPRSTALRLHLSNLPWRLRPQFRSLPYQRLAPDPGQQFRDLALPYSPDIACHRLHDFQGSRFGAINRSVASHSVV